MKIRLTPTTRQAGSFITAMATVTARSIRPAQLPLPARGP